MLPAFRALVRKDVRLFFSDRRALLMGLVAPIAIASFFGYVFGGNGGQPETSRIPVLAVDDDGGAIARDIVDRMKGDKSLLVTASTAAAARESVRKGKSSVAFLIPTGFGDAAGRAFFGNAPKPKLDMLYDPSHGAEANMVQGMLAGHVMEAVSKQVFSGPEGARLVKDSLKDIEASSGLPADQKKALTDMLLSVEQWNAQSAGSPAPRQNGLTIPFETKAEAVTSGPGTIYNGYAHAFGGMGIQFILMLGIEQGLAILLQRQRGVWKRLRAAPLGRATLLGSRAVSAAVTALFILMTMFLFARVVFGVRIHGSMAGFLGICAAFALMTAGFGLLIAALGKTPEATRGLAILVTLLMVMLGGAWVPAFIFPAWLQKITLFVPTRWAMDGLDAVTWRGLGFPSAIAPMAVLAGSALLFGVVAVMKFRWEE